MKNLIAWLKKYGYLYEIKTATENYFYNVPELSQEAATIEINTPDIKELRRLQKQLETHLNRYNYRIFIDARLQQHYDGTYHKYYYVKHVLRIKLLSIQTINIPVYRGENYLRLNLISDHTASVTAY